MIPKVKFRKTDFQTGVVRPSSLGVLAIIASGASGPTNVPTSCVDDGAALTEFGESPITEFASFFMSESGKPSVLIRSAASLASSYSAIVETGAGTSVITAGATAPLDGYDNVTVTFVTGGTIGVAGITYTYNLSQGDPNGTQGPVALGTANTLTIPGTGISLALAAGTVLAQQVATFSTVRPMSNSADVTAALEALRLTSLKWEAALIDIDADATTVALVDTWIAARNNEGIFPQVYLNTRRKAVAESEATYLAAMAVIRAAASGIDVVLSADGADVTSTLTGNTQFRPTSLVTAARVMSIAAGVEPAEVDLGPVNVTITDARGNPKYHNEEKSPGIDDLGMVTLRTFSGQNGIDGVFITNGNLFSVSGSDYVYIPQGRTLNEACGVGYQILSRQLSRGLAKNPKPGPNGERYVAEYEAQRIESLVNAAVNKDLSGQVDGFAFTMSRTDDISSNQGAKISCSMADVSLAYVKEFDVTAGFVKSLS